MTCLLREKEGDLTQSYDIKPLYQQKIKKAMDNTNTPPKNFDYTAIVDRLRMVGWSNNSLPTGVVKPGLKGTNPPTHHKSKVIKQTRHGRNIIYNIKMD